MIRLAPSFKARYSDLDAMTRKFHDRWLKPGDRTTIPAIITNEETLNLESGAYPYNAYNFSTEMIAKGDFLRVKTISLTYNLPSRWLAKSGFIHGISVTAAGSNLWMLYQDKRLNGQDPEFFNSGGVAQPLQKQVTFALNLTF